MPFTFCCHFPVLFPPLMYFFFNETSLSGYSAISASSSDCHLRSMKGRVQTVGSLVQCALYHEGGGNPCASSQGRGKNRVWYTKLFSTKFQNTLRCGHRRCSKGSLERRMSPPKIRPGSLFRDRFGNWGAKWKSLFWAEVAWACTGCHCFVLVPSLAVSCALTSKGSCRPSEMLALVEMTNKFKSGTSWGTCGK